MKNPIEIVIADDHPIFRRGLRHVIEAEPDLRVLAEAGDGKAALEEIRRHSPDVAVLDVQMPGLSGFGVAQELRKERLPGLVFLTMHNDPGMLDRAFEVGAMAYVLKDAALSEIVQAVRAAAAGRTFVSPSLSDLLVDRAFPGRAAPKRSSRFEALTDRERQILKLIAESKTSKEIGATLGVHYRTIENSRTAISQKLGLQGSHALVKFAFDHKTEL
ncbi:MAG TPA: response regulator transcription factor [Thermoanaerobaculia bacterium]|nr:response regulator transcription factor [Thermoanaerobaculia bacterium]